MTTKRSKVYVPYLYLPLKYKSIHVCIKIKEGWGAYIIISKGTVHFPKNKQNKLRQMKKDEMKEETTTVIKYTFCFCVCLFFIRWNYETYTKNVFVLFSSLNLLFACYNHSTKIQFFSFNDIILYSYFTFSSLLT